MTRQPGPRGRPNVAGGPCRRPAVQYGPRDRSADHTRAHGGVLLRPAPLHTGRRDQRHQGL